MKQNSSIVMSNFPGSGHKEVPKLRLLALEGVDRPVRRPKDKDDQKKNDSDKKKDNRKKNLLLSSGKRVVYLGPTSPGSVHDKKLAGESRLTYPVDALVIKDTGLQGTLRALGGCAPFAA